MTTTEVALRMLRDVATRSPLVTEAITVERGPKGGAA